MEQISLALPNELKRIQLRSRRLVTGDLLGQYRSAFRGTGLVFSDLREYQAGDEIKQIHWKATARTGTVYVKSYEEDRQLRVMLCVDVSPSMRASFGHRSYSRAIEFSALIGSLTQSGNDLLGLQTFSDAPKTYLAPKSGPKRSSRILSALLDPPDLPSSTTDISGVLDHLGATLKRSNIIFVVSDFECENFSNALTKLAARHDVVLVQIQPPHMELPEAGLVEFRDAESGELCTVDTSNKRVRKAWSVAIQRDRERVHSIARSAGVDHIVVSSDAAQPLITLMRERMKKTAR